ncbi:MAG: trypsin-like peptidase domain-containing protein [Oligoflexales bacterium]|nr:trypsin-like peptidase domain-containing protein [Oligoflexales bacterium]
MTRQIIYLSVLILISFLFDFTQVATAADFKNIRKTIFKISVVKQKSNEFQPWLKNPIQYSAGSGFYIQEGIITNAHVVESAKFITVQRDGWDHAVSATVKFIAHDCDLALLDIADSKMLEGIKPLPFGEFPHFRDTVNVIGYPTGGEQISITEGIVSRIAFGQYIHSTYHRHVLIQIDSAVNSGNSGGPVLKNGDLIGVAFQVFANAENTAYVIPVPLIQRFLKDVTDGSYDGHPDLGILTMNQVLENKFAREYYKITDKETGVPVNFVESTSKAAGKIQAGDILTRINGKKIGTDGKISYAGERVPFEVEYDLMQVGDEIKLSIVRDGKPHEFDVKLGSQKGRYRQGIRYDLYPRFYIHGGLIFMALSKNFIDSRQDMDQTHLSALQYLHENFFLEPRFQKVKDIIVLSGRLPGSINAYAEPYVNDILLSLNGKEIYSLEELASAIEQNDTPLYVYLFRDRMAPLILPKKTTDIDHEKLLGRYNAKLQKWLGDENEDSVSADWNH